MTIVAASPSDYAQIDALLAAAFGGTEEVRLMHGLREDGDIAVELIERRDNAVVGHIAFSPVEGSQGALALAPLSVSPQMQRKGIGSALAHRGLEVTREQDWRSVFVLGDPIYYKRFGFNLQAAQPFLSPYSGAHFMALELVDGSLAGQGGPLKHAAIFAKLEGGA